MSGRYDRPLTPEQIAAVKDEDIDFSDIPELDRRVLGSGGDRRARWHRPDHHSRQTLRAGLFQSSGKGLPDADEPRTRELRADQDGGSR